MLGLKDKTGSENHVVDNSKNRHNMFIPKDCLIKGIIESKGDVTIEGQIEGDVIVSGSLNIGNSAVITGNIEADSLVISGEFHGNVKATNLLEVGETGRLYGDISTKLIKIMKGAHFRGTCTHTDHVDEANKPQLSHSSLLKNLMAKNNKAV